MRLYDVPVSDQEDSIRGLLAMFDRRDGLETGLLYNGEFPSEVE